MQSKMCVSSRWRSIGSGLVLGCAMVALLLSSAPADAGGSFRMSRFNDRRAVKGAIGKVMRRLPRSGTIGEVPGAQGKWIPNQTGAKGGGGSGGALSFSSTAVEFNLRQGDLHVVQLPTGIGYKKIYLAVGKMQNGGNKHRSGARYVAVVTPDPSSRKGYQVLGSVNHGLSIVGAGSIQEARAATRNHVYSRDRRLGKGDRAQLGTQLGQLKRALRQRSVSGQQQAARDIVNTLIGPEALKAQGLSGALRPWHGSYDQWGF